MPLRIGRHSRFVFVAGLAVPIAALFILLVERPQPLAQPPLPIAESRPARQASGPLPAFRLPALGGGVVSATDLRGSPVVINFFASWCPSCWAEIPHLQRASQELHGRGLRILGISVLDDEGSLRWMVRKLGITYATVYDTQGDTVGNVLRLRTMPTTLFVDRQGIVRTRWEGFLDEETLHRLIGQIL